MSAGGDGVCAQAPPRPMHVFCIWSFPSTTGAEATPVRIYAANQCIFCCVATQVDWSLEEVAVEREEEEEEWSLYIDKGVEYSVRNFLIGYKSTFHNLTVKCPTIPSTYV